MYVLARVCCTIILASMDTKYVGMHTLVVCTEYIKSMHTRHVRVEYDYITLEYELVSRN